METKNAVIKENIRAAIVQKPPVFLNLTKSVDLALQYIAEAKQQGVELLVFPETWLPGYPVWLDYAPHAGIWDYPPAKVIYRILVENSIQIGDHYFQQLVKSALDHEITIVMGAHEKIDRTLYNSIFYFLPDGSHYVHRKLMPTYTERLIWGMGDGSTLPVFEVDTVRIGGLICWEHWMPLARAAMHQQNEFIHIAQWPMVKNLHQIASQNYAFEGQCFVLAAGCKISKKECISGLESIINSKNDESALQLLDSIPVEDTDNLLKGGSSMIKPNSEFLQNPIYDIDEILVEDLDLTLAIEGNLFLDTSGHYSRPDVFSLTVDTSAKSSVTFEN